MIDDPRQFLADLFHAGVAAASPGRCLPARLPAPPPGRVGVIACGKAALPMARLAAVHYGENAQGLVVHPGAPGAETAVPPGWTGIAASHPVPDEASLKAAEAALTLAADLGGEDRLLVLLSGGGSALMALPVAGVGLSEKQELTRRLLASGAAIDEINCVRKHLSRIKGGRLAAASRAALVTLAISDVPGDDPAVIASAPTVQDPTTLQQARAVLAHYGIAASQNIRDALRDPANETPDLGGRPASRYEVIASGMTALEAAAALCRDRGIEPIVLGDRLQGDAAELGMVHARRARRLAAAGRSCCLLSGGETTVRIGARHGRGGRNTAYALALAMGLDGDPRVWGLAADTDGIDGHGGHAGAVVSPETTARARSLGMEPAAFLLGHDSATLFEAIGELLTVGPTATNVNDFRAILVLA